MMVALQRSIQAKILKPAHDKIPMHIENHVIVKTQKLIVSSNNSTQFCICKQTMCQIFVDRSGMAIVRMTFTVICTWDAHMQQSIYPVKIIKNMHIQCMIQN